MLDNKDNNNIIVIFIELQVYNIFCPGGLSKCPILPPLMGTHGYNTADEHLYNIIL